MLKFLFKLLVVFAFFLPIIFFVFPRTQTANAVLPGECNDGDDNDWDGDTDGSDSDCTSRSDPSEGSLTYAPCNSTYSGPLAILAGVTPRVTISNMVSGHNYIIGVFNNQNIPTYQSPNLSGTSTPRTHSIPATAFPNSNQTYMIKVFDLQNLNAPCSYPIKIVVLDSITCSYEFSPKQVEKGQNATIIIKAYNTQIGYQYKGKVAQSSSWALIIIVAF